MPKYETVVPLSNVENETVLALACLAAQQLNWNIYFVVDNRLVGSTPKTWKTKGQQIVLSVSDNSFTITSSMENGELTDIAGKNKKNVTAFIHAFESVKATTDAPAIEETKTFVNNFRTTSLKK